MDTSLSDTGTRHPLLRGVRFLSRTFIEPRSRDEDTHRHEFILNIFLSASTILSFIFLCLVLYSRVTLGAEFRGAPPGIMAIFVGAFAFLSLLSYRGFIKTAAYLLVIIYLIPVTMSLILWGADLPQGLLGYGLLVILSGTLLGSRASFVTAGVAITILVFLTWLQNKGILTPLTYWKERAGTISDALATGGTLLTMAIIPWIANREIEKSMKRAHASERLLLQEREALEQTVEERTRDVKRLQAERVGQISRLAQFGRLAAGFFHDLTGPLTAISLNLEGVEKGETNAQEAQRSAQQAMKAAKRMELFLQSIRHQVQEPDIQEVFSPADEIREAIRVLEYKAREAETTLAFRDDTTGLSLFGNPFKFGKLVLNLIENAIDACEVAPLHTVRQVNIRLSVEEGRLMCRVQDTGTGIAAEHMEQIFEPFYTTKGTDRSMGIGLCIVRDVAEKDFNGTIQVLSERQKGSTFTVTIPLNKKI